MFKKLMVLLGLEEPDDDIIEVSQSAPIDERKGRVMMPGISSRSVIISHGRECLEKEQELAESLRKGVFIVLDLRGIEISGGQRLFDFISGVAYAVRGSVNKIIPEVYLIAPTNQKVEVWPVEKAENSEVNASTEPEDGGAQPISEK